MLMDRDCMYYKFISGDSRSSEKLTLFCGMIASGFGCNIFYASLFDVTYAYQFRFDGNCLSGRLLLLFVPVFLSEYGFRLCAPVIGAIKGWAVRYVRSLFQRCFQQENLGRTASFLKVRLLGESDGDAEPATPVIVDHRMSDWQETSFEVASAVSSCLILLTQISSFGLAAPIVCGVGMATLLLEHTLDAASRLRGESRAMEMSTLVEDTKSERVGGSATKHVTVYIPAAPANLMVLPVLATQVYFLSTAYFGGWPSRFVGIGIAFVPWLVQLWLLTASRSKWLQRYRSD
jgi:hypothetical protein